MKRNLAAAATVIAVAAQPLPVGLAQEGTPTPPFSDQQNQTQPHQDQPVQGEVAQRDRQFAQKAAADNVVELELARMAEEKASSDEVKQYAATLVEDHTKAGEELQRVATEQNLMLNAEVPQEAKSATDRLSSLDGTAFDRAFIEQMVTDHDKAVQLYEEYAANGRNEALKRFASSTVDSLRMHLDLARQLERQMGKQPVSGTPGGTPSASQQESIAGSDQDTDQQSNALMDIPAGDLIGKKVVNQQGDEVGEIEDIVVGTTDKGVRAIVSVGGFLGIGDKSIAMSFEELQLAQDDNVLLSSGATVEELKQRPAYDESSGDYKRYPAEKTPGEADL